MQSIVSTFIGLLFPHALEFDSDSNTVYFLLYETYSARYSVKVIADKELVRKVFTNYDPTWTLDSLVNKKRPIIISATGTMQQQTAGAAFLVCNSLKHMVHPEVGPTQLSEGVKEGYFLVNLSAVQNFDIGPEFFESTFAVNDDLERMDTLSDNGQPTNLADDQEIQDPDVLPPARHNNRSQMEDAEEDYDSESEAEAAAAEYYRSSRRFSDSSDDDDGFKITENKKDSNTVKSFDKEIKQTDQVIFNEDGNEIDEDLERIHRYVEEIEKEIVQQSSYPVLEEHLQSTNKNTATEKSSEAASRSDSQSTKPKSKRIIQPVNIDDLYVPHLKNNLESLKSRDKGKARDYGNTSHIKDNVNHLLKSSSADIGPISSTELNSLSESSMHPFFRKRNTSMSSNGSEISFGSMHRMLSSESMNSDHNSYDSSQTNPSKKRMDSPNDAEKQLNTVGKRAKINSPLQLQNEINDVAQKQVKRKPGRPRQQSESSQLPASAKNLSNVKRGKGRPPKKSVDPEQTEKQA